MGYVTQSGVLSGSKYIGKSGVVIMLEKMQKLIDIQLLYRPLGSRSGLKLPNK